jgi:hypothetical protein
MPTRVISSRHPVRTLMRAIGSLSALPSHTDEPSASTTQIDVVLSETSSPTNRAILRLLAGSNQPQTMVAEVGDRITPARARDRERLAGGTRRRGPCQALALDRSLSLPRRRVPLLNRSRRPRVHCAALRLTRYFDWGDAPAAHAR